MNNNRAHLLSLKVLRSSPPTLNTTTNQPTQTEIADTLSLPNSFGTIYQGEAFNGLLSLRLEQPRSNLIAALNPKLIVELQSSQSHIKTSLIGSIHAHQLGPASEHEALELLINHQITQLGLHSLICTVTYQEPPPTEPTEEEQELTAGESHQITPESEPQTRSFRKLYKFQVLNPLGIKTKTYRSPSSSSVLEETWVLESLKKVLAEIEAHDHHYDDTALSSLFDGQDRLGNDGSSSNDSCYMEIQIQNQSSKPLLNLTLNLLPQDQTQDNQEEEGESTTRKIEQIQLKQCARRTPTGAESDEQIMPGDIRQYAFKVSAKGRRGKQEYLRQYELEISWTSLMGERGRVRRRIEADEPTTTTTPMPTRPTTTTTMTMGIESSGCPTVVAQSRFFKAELLRDARPIVAGVPFQVELRISSSSNHPQIGPGSEPQYSRLQAILASPLLMGSLRIHDIHPLLLLLSPQPLLPLSSPAHPDSAPSFLLTYLPLHLPLLPAPLSLGRLTSSSPHLDSLLFGLDSSSSSKNSASLGSVFLHHS
ncbi:hypothetical protein PGT21_029866 [Puccinia graminis f. sp. tritici]|uniref:Trafficking protein particle complex subunit 13 N-terminal domain-containing protein n=1 Tax=Puccinia graminis f. sp. tritici TaxID=56615 RepID=A0A5B0MZ86_PUCGR|nr:hypothetical protein PGT21_029866 [Puccinia graminis f. sp. tritici]KAA1131289.1 hypothetical protein PGTUg99_029634 [Puccinia graminis f. sp. tritici]